MKNSNFKFKFLLLTTYSFLLTVFYSCHLPALAPNSTVINKSNPDFLKEAGVDEKTNPHKNEMCEVCHIASRELLTKEKPSTTEVMQRKSMRTNLIDLCSQCHLSSVEVEHPVGMPAKSNRENLPLDQDGKLTCATTCHNVHVTDPDLAKKMLRKPFDTMCLSCHDM